MRAVAVLVRLMLAGLVGAAVCAVPVRVAVADELLGSTPLPMPSVVDLAVDPLNDHVFVSGGAAASPLVVLNFDGSLAATVDEVPRADGLVVRGTSLYVARAGDAAIDVIDATTLARVRTIALPVPMGPGLADAGGRLWFLSDEPCSFRCHPLVSVEPLTGTAVVHDQGPRYEGASFATAPGAPDTLVVVDAHDTDKLSVAAGPIELPTTFDPPATDAALTADGSRLLTAAGRRALEFRMSDLQPTGISYVASVLGWEDATAVATSPVGPGYVAVGFSGVPALAIFADGDTTPLLTLRGGREGVQRGALAFAPDASALFAVEDDGAGRLTFDVYAGPVPRFATLELFASKDVVGYGSKVRVTARLGAVDGVVGRTVTIYATPFGEPERALASGQVDEGGLFSVRARLERRTSFVARWGGGGGFLPAESAPRVVDARPSVAARVEGAYGMVDGLPAFHTGDVVREVGTVVPNHSGSPLDLVTQRRSSSGWSTVATTRATIGEDGSGAGRFTTGTPGAYRVRAQFPGDADHAASDSVWVRFSVTR